MFRRYIPRAELEELKTELGSSTQNGERRTDEMAGTDEMD